MLQPPSSLKQPLDVVRAIQDALTTEFRRFPTVKVSRDAQCSLSAADVSNWVSHRTAASPEEKLFLGVPDSTLASLAGALGADSHPEPRHHSSRTFSTILQASLTRVSQELTGALGAPAIELDNGSGSPDEGLELLAAFSITWESEAGTVLLVGSRSLLSISAQNQPASEAGPQLNLEATRKPANNLLFSVEMPVTLSLGSTAISFGEALSFASGSVVKLGCPVDAPVDIIVGGKTIARGTVVSVEGMYGVRVSEVLFEQLSL